MPAFSQPRVIIFTSSSCPWCNRVKQYLREKRFRYREVNVERDPEDYLVNSLRQAVIKLGAKAEVSIVEMNQEERLAFLAMEQEGWKGL